MNRIYVLVVILFGVLSAIICSNNSLNETKSDENNSIETPNEELVYQKLKANELLESALNLLRKTNYNELEVRNAYSLLEESAKLDNARAKEMVAKSHLFGDHLPLDMEKAFNYLQSIPTNQSSSAHLFLGFMYWMGLGVIPNQEKALFHYKCAAHLNNSLAKMVIAFRYSQGLGIERSCYKALKLYESVATHVVEESQHFGGNPIVGQHLWLKKEKSNPNIIDRDLMDYYKFLVKGGDIKAGVSLGELYYFGGYGVPKNREKALNYFRKAAKSGNTNALTFLGKYHLEGSSSIEQNYTKAFQLFHKSVQKGNPIAMTEIGLMYKNGKGVDRDYGEAFKYFAQSLTQGWVDAILQVGTMYLDGTGVKQDYRKAIKYLTQAAQSNHLIAIYHLGQLEASGIGVMRSCPKALISLKSVAERGVWSEMMTEAYDDYENGRIVEAFIKFAFLSELGYELSQSNTAFIAENYDLTPLKSYLSLGPALALNYWTKSAAQGLTYSRIKVGDYHYYGLGTPVDYKTAAFYYRRASEFRYSAQALFNLGYMSEKGLGVDRNLKMAKNYYEMAAQVDSDAKVPVFLVKLKLRAFEMSQTFVECIDLRQYFGTKWDLVLIGVLTIVLGIVLSLKFKLFNRWLN